MLIVDQPDVAELKKRYETELLVKEGIIKELRSIILEKNQDKQSLDRQQLVGWYHYTQKGSDSKQKRLAPLLTNRSQSFDSRLNLLILIWKNLIVWTINKNLIPQLMSSGLLSSTWRFFGFNLFFFLQIEIKRKNQRENHIYYSQSKLSKSIRKAEGLEQTLPL